MFVVNSYKLSKVVPEHYEGLQGSGIDGEEQPDSRSGRFTRTEWNVLKCLLK